jgi:hypothetical protein
MVTPVVVSGGAHVWQGSGYICREDVFRFDLRYKEFYIFCAFSAICKDNASINCTDVQQKNGSFPSVLTGHTTQVLL